MQGTTKVVYSNSGKGKTRAENERISIVINGNEVCNLSLRDIRVKSKMQEIDGPYGKKVVLFNNL